MADRCINGQPWRQQALFNDSMSAATGTWYNSSSELPAGLAESCCLMAKNRVYLFGGATTVDQSVIYTAGINASGILDDTWTTHTQSLPVALSKACLVMTRNRFYIFGGETSGVATTAILTAPINSDGTIGTITTDSNTLPVALRRSTALVIKGYVYLFGGYNTTYTRVIYRAAISEAGIVGTFSAYALQLDTNPNAYTPCTVFTNSNLYYFGAFGVRSAYDGDGDFTSWSSPNYPETLYYRKAFVTSQRCYLFGGTTGSTGVNYNYTTAIDVNGLLGVHVKGTALNMARFGYSLIVTSSKIYIIGGRVTTSATTVISYHDATGGLNDYMDKSWETIWDGTISGDGNYERPVDTIEAVGVSGNNATFVEPKPVIDGVLPETLWGQVEYNVTTEISGSATVVSIGMGNFVPKKPKVSGFLYHAPIQNLGEFRERHPNIEGFSTVSLVGQGAYRIKKPVVSAAAINLNPAYGEGEFSERHPSIAGSSTVSLVGLGAYHTWKPAVSATAVNLHPAYANGEFKERHPEMAGTVTNPIIGWGDFKTPSTDVFSTSMHSIIGTGSYKPNCPKVSGALTNYGLNIGRYRIPVAEVKGSCIHQVLASGSFNPAAPKINGLSNSPWSGSLIFGREIPGSQGVPGSAAYEILQFERDL